MNKLLKMHLIRMNKFFRSVTTFFIKYFSGLGLLGIPLLFITPVIYVFYVFKSVFDPLANFKLKDAVMAAFRENLGFTPRRREIILFEASSKDSCIRFCIDNFSEKSTFYQLDIIGDDPRSLLVKIPQVLKLKDVDFDLIKYYTLKLKCIEKTAELELKHDEKVSLESLSDSKLLLGICYFIAFTTFLLYAPLDFLVESLIDLNNSFKNSFDKSNTKQISDINLKSIVVTAFENTFGFSPKQYEIAIQKISDDGSRIYFNDFYGIKDKFLYWVGTNVVVLKKLFVQDDCTYYRDTVTDIMWVKNKNDPTMIINSDTGLPLTYSEARKAKKAWARRIS